MNRLCQVCFRLVELGECPEHPDFEPEYMNRPAEPPKVPDTTLAPEIARATLADVLNPEQTALDESICSKCFRSPTCIVRLMPPDALLVVSRCRLFEPATG